MRDYYPIVAGAVSKLERNTPATRDVLFGQVRSILVRQLEVRTPPASEPEIIRERAALEHAIRKVEAELAAPTKSSSESNDALPARRAYRGRPFPVSNIDPGDRQNVDGFPSLFKLTLLKRAQRSFSYAQLALRRLSPFDLKKSFGRAPADRNKATHISANGITAARVGEAGSVKSSKSQGRPNELTETASAQIIGNLRGILLLDQLMSDAAQPWAPGSLRHDARAVLKWLEIKKTEEINSEHYKEFTSALQAYNMEWRAISKQCDLTTVDLPIALTDELRGVLSRLIEREEAAEVFDQVLGWFAKAWIALIAALNFVAVVVLFVAAPTLQAGMEKSAEMYNPFNLWCWIVQAVALSPALVAMAWQSRRLNRSIGAALVTSEPRPSKFSPIFQRIAGL